MKKLGKKGQRWLKSVHILFSSIWVGGGVALTMMLFSLEATADRQLYGINQALHFVDMYVIVPGAVGVVVTGLLYSLFTNWGWFKHHWITVKWVIAAGGMLFGTFFLGPWDVTLLELSEAEGLAALSTAEYDHARQMLLVFGPIQAATLVLALFLSSLRPWGRRQKG